MRRRHGKRAVLRQPTDRLVDPVAEGDPLPPADSVQPRSNVALAYRAHRPRLLRFLDRRAHVEDPEDIVQQAFTRYLSHEADGGARVGHPSGYLFRIARNLVIDLGKASHRQSRDQHIALDAVELAGPDQIAALEARDLLHRLEAVLLRMKPRTREIFLAHRIDGYSYGEIAARTGLSIKGVEKHMSRAIAYIDRSMRVR